MKYYLFIIAIILYSCSFKKYDEAIVINKYAENSYTHSMILVNNIPYYIANFNIDYKFEIKAFNKIKNAKGDNEWIQDVISVDYDLFDKVELQDTLIKYNNTWVLK